MNELTVLILAAESGSKKERWKQMGTPKQLIEIQGEPILQRTLRLLSRYGVQFPYLITSSEAFKALPAVCWCPLQGETKAHSLVATQDLWSTGSLLVLYSDVYYTDAAFDAIMNNAATSFYGRPGRSAYTFKNYGEIFAIRINSDDRGRALAALQEAIDYYERTGNQSFWVFYRLIAGLGLDTKNVERQYFFGIHDETDDVDFASEVQPLLDAIEKKPGWRLRHFARRVSLLNKRRRDWFRKMPYVSTRT